MKRLAIIVIHGMGSQQPDFADPMVREINCRVKDLGKNPDAIAWQPVFWQDILEPRQLAYLGSARRRSTMDFVRLRQFILTAFGDAVAYQLTSRSPSAPYQMIHARIAAALRRLYRDQLDARPQPLIVFAHSLGGHIVSNFIWDQQAHRQKPMRGISNFERAKTLVGMVTFGCNIPLFTFAFDKVQPIKVPAPEVRGAKRAKAKWLNFYDPDDVLGYPLKPICPGYANVVSKDVPINVGGVLSSWNPMSHAGYWTDNDFTKPAAKFVASFL